MCMVGGTGLSFPVHNSSVKSLLLPVLVSWEVSGNRVAVPTGPMAEGDVGSDQKQSEEIEAMAAIYGEEWCVIDDRAKIFCIRISDDIDDPKWTLCLQVMLPSEYPGTAPPVYQLNAPWLKGQERADLSNSLEEIYIQNIGESILYLWVEKIRDVLIQKAQVTEPEANIFAAVLSSQRSGERVESVFFDFWIHVLISQHSKLMRNIPDVKKKTKEKKVERDVNVGRRRPGNSAKKSDRNVSEHVPEVEELPPIDHGVPITDRRSTFQAHVAPVSCFKQVEMVLAKLYENKKVASATHNVYAYRIFCEDKQTFLQDCEDDGETAAGGRLLHLMEILNVKNVIVVVSRWYGGILLGPDRFKHINNCARNILVERNFTRPPEESSKHLGKKKVKKDKKRNDH
ncbi:protein IMPACT isoform X2 [Mesocricetus auratus]|uniref:Protein IMPACT n=1 Tax=Mesocricetus auratus TaxID=10036 RepID=A0ABM2YG77_MESAU|nr:protein IMPACT isoform X2 [Mesocricetus auratus]